ncbi:RKD1 [Acrasis kona]|uniref:RKD1 n=1 Tax=Acrasis kona TaxID=1008807 RepID=A0AAW2Z8L8_9EUKA
MCSHDCCTLESESNSSTKPDRFTFHDIQNQFSFPISEAAKNLRISESFLKKTCRRLNINRWPYRRLSSLQKHVVADRRGCPKRESLLISIIEEIEALKNPSTASTKVLINSAQNRSKMREKIKKSNTLKPSCDLVIGLQLDVKEVVSILSQGTSK